MNKQRIANVVANMQKEGLDYLIISEPSSIDYLIDYVNHPGERMYVLVLSSQGNHQLFFNKLFFVADDLGIDITWHSDTDDATEFLAKYISDAKKVGVDKHWSANFLLSLMDKLPVVKFVNGSECVDYVRMVKDETEQKLMIEASKINDLAMNEVIKLVGTGLTEKQIADHLKNRNSVVVNLKRVTSAQAKRIIDFLSGCIYSIGGTMQKIGVGIYLCTPKNVNVQGKITDDNDNTNKREKNNEEELDW